jgi:methionine-rich copper-binding protein CopC
MIMNKSLRLGAAVVTAAVVATAAVPAFAHAPVKVRTPGPGKTASSVKKVSVTFGEAVVAGKISVRHKGGTTVTAKSSGLNAKKTVLSAKFTKSLAPGAYTANWRVKADDGDSETGHWSFTAR